MKRINKALSLMLTAALSCAVLAGQASAASGDALWADVDETSGEVAAVIETNAVVTDGVIDVTFDADKLTYVGCDFEGKNDQYTPYVAMYAVNDTQADQGVLKISWVAPDSYQAQEDLTVSGSAHDAQGEAVAVGQEPTEPTPSANPTNTPEGGDNTERPETGDTANLTLYVALVAVCVAVLSGFGIYAKRRAAK